MSKINDLIKALCHNGVEYKQLQEIADTFIGLATSVTKHKSSEGVILLHNSDIKQNKIVLKNIEFIDKSFADKNINKYYQFHDIATVHTGDVGTSAVIEEDYVGSMGFTTLVTRIYNFDYVNPYYLCHYFNSQLFKNAVAKVTISDRSNLNQKEFCQLIIPIPPLEIQEEIVRILDKFGELEAELEDELEARKSQYEFWRGQMFKRKGNTKISDMFTRVKGTAITAGKMKEIEDTNGKIRIFAGGQTAVNANLEDIPKANIIDYPCVIVQSRGLIDFVYYDKPFTFKNEMWAYSCDNQVTVKYLYYYLKNNVNYFREIGTQMGSMPQISLPVTEKFEIYLPTLEEQKKVVDILDKFEKLISDISIGLPLEIELRKKQYEYYRNKLLSFEVL